MRPSYPKRAQIIIEFLMMVAMAILLCALYLAVAGDLFAGVTQQQRVGTLNDIGYNIQDEIVLATSVEDGYLRNFTIPETAGDFQYSLSNDQDTLTLNSGSIIMNYPLPQVSGTLVKGTNTIRKDGVITVNT